VERGVSVTVTVEVVAVDRKQLQALLMRALLDEHSERMASAESGDDVGAESAVERVGVRFRYTVLAMPSVLYYCW
jgi:hypothetical protein